MAFRIKFTMDNGTCFKTRNLKDVNSFAEAKGYLGDINGQVWLESWEGTWFTLNMGKVSSVEIIEVD